MTRSLVLLSGEGTTLPRAEAEALFFAYDPASRFEEPEPRVLIAESTADPFLISSRVAFARRVGLFIEEASAARSIVSGKRIRVRNFDLTPQDDFDPERTLRGIDTRIDLRDPEFEFTVVRGKREYLAITSPMDMHQTWAQRRPRARAFFHPSAIFPKLSRALVNLTRCRAAQVFLDPFCGTGSLPLEAAIIGAKVVCFDQLPKMTAGSLSNMKAFRQSWLGVLRADALHPPLRTVDAIATDLPYGRVSSTRGMEGKEVMQQALLVLPEFLRQGAIFVMMHRKDTSAQVPRTLELIEEHDLYVHKFLTRTISVLRRR